MKRFSTIDFEGNFFIVPGRADASTLDTLADLNDTRMEICNTETVDVFIDTYYLNDGVTEYEGDLSSDEDLSDLNDNFADYVNDGLCELVEEQKFVLTGLLPVPFEDFYHLEGEQRQQFLTAKEEVLADKRRLLAEMQQKGFTAKEIENWFRFDYWIQIQAKEADVNA